MKAFTAILLAIFAASALAAEPAATQPISNTRYGARSVSVRTNGSSIDFNELLAYLNKRQGELGPTILNIPADKMGYPTFTLNANSRDSGIELGMDLNTKDFPDAKPAAREFLNAMVESMQKFVQETFDERRAKEMALARRDQDVCAQQLDQATAEAKELRARLRDLAGQADVSTQGVTSAVSRLEEEKQKIELDLLGKKARREAIEKEIAEQTALLQKQAEDDPVVKELKTIVEVRTAKLDNVKKAIDSGAASQGDLSDAIAAVAEARAKLAERQRGGGAIAGGAQTLESLSRERVNLSVDLHELEARLEFVSKRLPSLRSTMDKLDELQRAEGNLASARAALEASTNRAREIARKVEAADPPQVMVNGSRDSDAPLNPPLTVPGR